MESAEISQSTTSFGTNLMLELFSWIPAKGVVKYFSSSKILLTVLSESLFRHKQSINSSHLDGGFFLQPDTCWNVPDNLDFHVLPRGPPPSLFGIPAESLSFLQQNGRVLASSQGLVLLHKLAKGADEFLICNPVTRRCTPLPIPADKLQVERFIESGLLIECHPRSLDAVDDFPNEYTITTPVLVDDETDPWRASHRLAVYRHGKWDDDTCDLRIPMRQLHLDMPVGVFRGPHKHLVIHYLCDSLPNALRRPVFLEPYVVAYDVERKELWKTFKLPKGAWLEDGDHSKLKIFKWGMGETVGLVRTDRRRLTVWVLEDYERASWRRVVEETTEEMGVPLEEGDVVGCCIGNGKELVFATGSRVYAYEMEGPDPGRLEVVGEHGCREVSRVVFTLYANTFRPVCGGKRTVIKF